MNVKKVCVGEISVGRESQRRGYISGEEDESIHHLYI
jgi:hypothetical protein